MDDAEILDDVALQAIKGQVRSIVDKELNQKIRETIQEKVESDIKKIVDSLKQTGWYSSDKVLRDTLRQKMLEKAAEMSISTDGLKRMIDDYMKPLNEYANQKIMDFQKQEKEIDNEITDQIRRRVDALFKTTLTAALAEALIKNGGQ